MDITNFDGGLFNEKTFTDPVRGARDMSVFGPAGTIAGAAIGTVGRIFRKGAQRAKEEAEAARREAQRVARENRNKQVERNYARRRATQGAGMSIGDVLTGGPKAGNGTVTNTTGNASSKAGTMLNSQSAPSILG